MYFLQEAMAAGPFMLAIWIFILIALVLAFYLLLKIIDNTIKIKNIKKGNKENSIEKIKKYRTKNVILFPLIIIVLYVVIKLIWSVTNIKFD